MAISKRLIESFGGEITVSNKADLEPEFVIRLPQAQSPE
jgi:signal transduction histidine kinase